MHLHQAIGWRGPITWRQYRAWQDWLTQELNNPGLTEHYLMQVAAEVRRSWVKNPGAVDDSRFQIRFEPRRPRPRAPTLTVEQATAFSKTRWLGIMTSPVKDQDGNPVQTPFATEPKHG